jgi:uncharacterized glyoxalase superfamily protein PhnB
MKIKQLVPLVVTDRLEEVKSFYGRHFGFEPSFDHESFLALRAPSGAQELSFMRSEKEASSFPGSGLSYCFEVEDVDAEHARLTEAGLKVGRPLQDNPWGDRSFSVSDPVGIEIYVYKTIPPAKEYEASFKE